MTTNVGGQDFEAIPEITPPQPGIRILSGTVSGPVVSGVTINLQGTMSASTTTSVSGNYSFSNLEPGVYVVTPSYADHTFAPPYLVVNIGDQDLSNENFVSIAPVVPEVFTLSGTVTGEIIQGVQIDLSGSAAAQTFTDVNGDYTFINLPEGTYAIVPSEAGYEFVPRFRIVTLPNV